MSIALVDQPPVPQQGLQIRAGYPCALVDRALGGRFARWDLFVALSARRLVQQGSDDELLSSLRVHRLDTWCDKLRWRLIARRVLRRWRLLVCRAALARVVKFIERMVWRHEPRMLPLARHTAKFLVA